MKFSFKIRSMLSFSVLGVVLLIVGFASFITNKKIATSYSEVIEDNLPKMKLIGPLTGFSKESAISVLILPNFIADKDKVDELKRTFNKRVEKFEENIDNFQKLPLHGDEKTALNELQSKWQAYLSASNKAFELAAASKGLEEKAKIDSIVSDEVGSIRVDLNDILLKLAGIENDGAEKEVAEAHQQANRLSNFMMLGVLIGFGFSIFLGWIFSNFTSKAIGKITDEVATVGMQVSSASGSLSKSAEDLSSTAQEQAAAIEETSASVTEMSGTIESNNKFAEYSNKIAAEADGLTRETQRWMQELSDAMRAILESNQRISKLVQIIEEIGNKTEVIDEIVFKTQLLSFNASVEAERAGEHGRGFAVVAQEVGNLAQMSGKAATEIEGIVKNSIREAETVASDNKDRVTKGEHLANETKAKLENVMQRMTEIISSTNQIMTASKEQSSGISQISISVENLNQTAQQTASTAEETASSSSELSTQADALMNLVGHMQEFIAGERKDIESGDVEIEQPLKHENVKSLSRAS